MDSKHVQHKTVYSLLIGALLATVAAGCKKDDGGGAIDMAISLDGGGDDMSVASGDGGAADLTAMGIPLDAFPDGGVVVIVDDGGATRVCVVTACAGKVYLCGNCLDDDSDGLTDSDDPDCLGPCQNNEAGFEGNIPGQNNAPCKADCYWDKDSGGGGDACSWSHKCDPFEEGGVGFDPKTAPEIGCTYDPNAKVPGASVPNGQKDCEYLKDNQTTQCTSYCAPLTPNGCDCFGCCENPNDPGHFVYAGSVNALGQGTCSAKPVDLDDPTRCKPCTPVAGDCYKQCDRCELCFGKTTVPADCVQTQMPDMFGQAPPDLSGVTVDMVAPPMQCPTGVPACGLPGQPDCGTGGYCISGCCVFAIP